MKPRILFVFAILDAWIIVRHGFASVRQATRFLGNAGELPPIIPITESLRLLLVALLIGSLWLTYRGSRGVRRLTWLELPLRLFFAGLGEPQYLSMTFLRPAALAWIPGPPNPIAVLGALAAIDLLRAFVTLWAAPRRSRSRPLPTPAPQATRAQ